MTTETVIAGVVQRDPAAAWAALERGEAALVDVRSAAEWTFVGVPDLSSLGRSAILVEWRGWPGGTPNAGFVDAVLAELGENPPTEIQFLCRSGVRSQAAAEAMASELAARGLEASCVNVIEGFEGDLDAGGRRGAVGGWKACALPWRQS